MTRLTRSGELKRKMPIRKRSAKKKPDPYDAWLHEHCTCVVTGQPEFQNAHTGGLAEGKGTGTKAHRSTMLPLVWWLHAYEEKNRKVFWPTVGLPDYLDIAADLFKAFENNQDPTPILAEAQARVDREYVRAIHGEIGF